MVKVACSLVAALLLASSGAAYSRSQAHPTTLVWAGGKIEAFAQDGDQIAWASIPNSQNSCSGGVRIRLLGKHQQKVIACYDGEAAYANPASNFALAGKRALWKTEYCGNYCHQGVVTGSFSGKRARGLEDEVCYEYDPIYGDFINGAAGDSSTLVYGITNVGGVGPCGDNEDWSCTSVVSGGSVKRVTDTGAVTVPGAPPPFILASSGRRIALVVAESASSSGEPGPGSPAHVEVMSAMTGAHVGSFATLGKPYALAFSTTAVGVLVSVSGEKQIEFYSPTGEPIRSVVVPTGATNLSLAGTRAVFRVGKSIRTVGVRTGSVRQIATAKAIPIGLSIEGKRVAWAENVKIHGVLRGRIRAITVR